MNLCLFLFLFLIICSVVIVVHGMIMILILILGIPNYNPRFFGGVCCSDVFKFCFSAFEKTITTIYHTVYGIIYPLRRSSLLA